MFIAGMESSAFISLLNNEEKLKLNFWEMTTGGNCRLHKY
jgi:hypothetical protein